MVHMVLLRRFTYESIQMNWPISIAMFVLLIYGALVELGVLH